MKMKQMIRVVSVVLILVCVIVAASVATYSSSNEARYGEPDANGIREFIFILGMDASKDTVTYYYGKTLADELFALSGGRMKVEVYADGTLGGDLALLESCHAGNVTMVVQNTAPQVNFIPELGVFDLPMAYPTIDEFRETFADEAFMSLISDHYEAAGYRLLGFADQTFRVMSSNKAVRSIDDLKGIKIRTMENPNHIAFWKAIGASSTPMAFGELYTGLQQGTVTGQENPYAVIAANKLYEVQDYIIQTNHLPHILSLIMNPEMYDVLNAEEQALLQQAVERATDATLAEADAFEARKIEEIVASGTEIIPVSPELYAEMRASAQPVYTMIAEKVGQDLVDAYLGQ